MEHKIIVRNTAILITNYDIGDSPKLENNFKMFDRINFKEYHFGMYYDEDDRILYLPRGIDIWFVERALNEKAYIDKNYNKYDYIEEVKLRTLPRDDVQREALKFLIGTGKYKNNESKSQLSLNLATGKGKSYSCIATKAYFEIKSIVITFSTNWLQQWKDYVVEYTNIKANEILTISGSAIVNRLLKTKQEDLSRYKMFLVTHSTIKSYSTKYGWKAIGELFKHIKVGIKFYDESHLNFLNITMIDFYTNVYKTYYITATPARSSEEENYIYKKYFMNVPSIDLYDEDEDPHTKYKAIKYRSKPTAFEIQACRNQYGLDRNRYCNYLTEKEEFHKMLVIIMDLCLKVEGKCLIYIGTNYTISYVYRWILINYPELYNEVGIYTTLTPTELKEEQKEKKIILSTTKSCGAAMDIKKLKMTINLAEPFKSEVLAVQTLGRTRDDNTFYIDLVDMSFEQCRKYYYYKKPIFEKRAVSCTEITLNEYDLDARASEIITNRLKVMQRPLITFESDQPTQLVTFE